MPPPAAASHTGVVKPCRAIVYDGWPRALGAPFPRRSHVGQRTSAKHPSSTTGSIRREDRAAADQAAHQPARPGAWPIRRASPAACDEIVRDPREVSSLTARGNLVGVVTNGTAVLGLDAIGPLAAKPVMEGKAVLFKKFAGIDCFDIEINELDPDKLVDMIVALEPTFGGINLEDIKAPECFYIEKNVPRADEDPGVPRRPARHGDHRRRGGDERAARGRQGTGTRSSSCARARAPRRSRASTSSWGSASSVRTSSSPTSRASSTRAATEEMDEHKAIYAQPTQGAHAGRDPARRRHLPRPLRRAAC